VSYASSIATAKRLLGRKGKLVTVTRPGAGAIDEIAGTRSTGGSSSSSFYVVGLPTSGRTSEMRIGSLVNRKLQTFYMARASGTLDPEVGDLVPWVGKNWPLIWVGSYDPDGSGNTIFTEAYAEIAA
jgi:hypothetical protein